ncbi:ankyrin repeat-containing domain protein [Nemania sp. FL0916]|nr:ankyrin repeat-containing domain protein [Nemania sp. FL0916]
MFRLRQIEHDSFVLVLERHGQDPKTQVRHHVLTCHRTIELAEIERNFADIDRCYLNKHSVSNGVLDLKVTVSLERVGKQDMFVVKLLWAEEKAEANTVTNMLQQRALQAEAADAFRRYHRACRGSEKIQASIEERRRGLAMASKRLVKVRENPRVLYKEESQLQEAEKTLIANFTRFGFRSHELDALRDALLDKAQGLQQSVDMQLGVPDGKNKSEDWTDSAIKEMLDKVPEGITKTYDELVSDPIHKFLVLSARTGHEAPFRELAKLNIDANIVNTHGQSLLNIAASNGYTQIVKILLIMGAVTDMPDVGGYTALASACTNGHLVTARLLLGHGANIESRCSELESPLYLAAYGRGFALVEHLLEFGAEIESATKHCHTPLMNAAACGDEAVVRLLLSWGANKDATGVDGYTVKYWAKRNYHWGVVRLLDSLDSTDRSNRALRLLRSTFRTKRAKSGKDEKDQLYNNSNSTFQ